MANLIGKELGKYRVTERIGRGGMAEVYLGVHTMLDRPVAIKVLHGYLTEDLSFIERFKREAKSVANLRHPNIVQVYDFDIYEDMLFMVMEYIEGTNLHERLVALEREGKRLPIKQVGSIINDIAGALDYAHTQGMLHRDVKPSNILLDAAGKAYLTDFGIARILNDHKLTATGTMLGTPAYMSPEQGRGDELTEESDIYSLGIVAFEMLTGQVPYDAGTPIGIVNKQITEPVPAISSLVDGMPETAQGVIDRALAKSPKSRYSSAVELVAALRVALQALESSEQLLHEPSPEDEEKAAAPTVAPSAKVGAGEDTLSASTGAMTEPDLEKSTVAMPEAEADHATVAMEEPDQDKATVAMEGPALDKATVAMESEEIPPSQKTTKGSKEKLAPSPAGKKKMPLWTWIAIGALVLGGTVFAVTQMLPGKEAAETPVAEVIVAEVEESTPKPQSEESEPGEVVFDAENMDGGLILRLNEDVDVEVVTAGENQETAWRTGNGEVLPDVDGNGESDTFIMFDIDNDFLFEFSDPGLQVQIEVEYLDEGTDTFQLQYDAQTGGPYGNGKYKEAAVIQKTNSGEFKTAVFKLDDVFFGDRMGPPDGLGDFRIFDMHDGAETFRRVTVKLCNGECYFLEGNRLQGEGELEEAIQYYTLALEAGIEDARVYRDRGQAYHDLEQNIPCIDDFSVYISLVPDDPWGVLRRGQCYDGLKQLDLATRDYEAFLDMTDGVPGFEEDREKYRIWLYGE